MSPLSVTIFLSLSLVSLSPISFLYLPISLLYLSLSLIDKGNGNKKTRGERER